MERFTGFCGGVASGTNKTFLNLHNVAASPTARARIFYASLGSDDTPGDQAMRLFFGRTTGVGTEGAGFTPNNLDPAGPAGAWDFGVGTFTVEPTYTSNKELKITSVNQRANWQWYANEGCELVAAATQNNGIGIKSSASTSTQAYELELQFTE